MERKKNTLLPVPENKREIFQLVIILGSFAWLSFKRDLLKRGAQR